MWIVPRDDAACGGRAGRDDRRGAPALGLHAGGAIIAALDRADRFREPLDQLAQPAFVDRHLLARLPPAQRR